MLRIDRPPVYSLDAFSWVTNISAPSSWRNEFAYVSHMVDVAEATIEEVGEPASALQLQRNTQTVMFGAGYPCAVHSWS